MAYLRTEKENIEVSYPIEKIWADHPKRHFKTKMENRETDQKTHHVKAKTTGAFLSYGSDLLIDLSKVDEKTTRMMIKAETPVTTITSVADFGRTKDRIEMFIETLAELMNT